MTPWPRNPYITRAIEHGLSKEEAMLALSDAHQVQNHGLPAILTLKHLSIEAGASYGFLRSVVTRRHDPYRTFQIRKRRGGRRVICVPELQLLRVQQWLHDHVLRQRDIHHSAYAYFPGASILRCASLHSGCKWLIKVDIETFFESISEIDVYRVFRSVGYQALVSFELARLCTRLDPSSHNRSTRWYADARRQRGPLEYSSRQLGHLPQGAPTSPMLSNLSSRTLDSELERLATDRGLVYTRYSDDLIFSSSERTYGRVDAQKLVFDVYRILGSVGFRPNRTKTTITGPGCRRVVLGLLVDGERPRLTRTFRDKMDLHLHYIEKYGAESHARKRGFDSVIGLRRHLEGLAAHARSVDRSYGMCLEQRLNSANWPI